MTGSYPVHSNVGREPEVQKAGIVRGVRNSTLSRQTIKHDSFNVFTIRHFSSRVSLSSSIMYRFSVSYFEIFLSYFPFFSGKQTTSKPTSLALMFRKKLGKVTEIHLKTLKLRFLRSHSQSHNMDDQKFKKSKVQCTDKRTALCR